MTVAREAIALPVIFLSAVLVAAIRVGGTTTMAPPSPYVLLLGVLVVRVTVQSGALAVERLLASTRSMLANINGAAVIVTLWLAAAQTLAVLIPESGVPRVAFSVFFLILLLNTAATAPDRHRLIQSLAVTFGAAFVLKFVVLDALSGPSESGFRSALLALLDGVTAGALVQRPQHPVSAYLALLAVAFFLFGVFLLPHRSGFRDDQSSRLIPIKSSRPVRS